MTACRVLALVWPGAQAGDALVGQMQCACGQPGLFRLKPLEAPFIVEGAGFLHPERHAAPIWLLCQALLAHDPDPVAHVHDLQESADADWLAVYASSQGHRP